MFIDGEEAWKLDVKGKPLDQPLIVEAIGSLGKGLRELLELLGFKVRRARCKRGMDEVG